MFHSNLLETREVINHYLREAKENQELMLL